MRIRLALIILFSTFSISAHAQFFTGPISSAIGGAGRAAIDPSEAGLLNPATVAHLRRYYVSGNYGFGSHVNDGDLQQFGVLLADGTEGNAFPGSLSYVRRTINRRDGVRLTQSDINIAIAEFAGDRIAFGLSAHRRTDELSSGGDWEQYNGTLGILVTPYEFLGLGFVLYDFLPLNDFAPAGVQTVPTFAIGSNFLIGETFRIRLDLVRPDKQNPNRRTNVMAGFDSYFRPDFSFRFGGLWSETTDQTFVTAGLGYKGPKLSFDYTFQKDVRVAEGARHLFDLWIPF